MKCPLCRKPLRYDVHYTTFSYTCGITSYHFSVMGGIPQTDLLHGDSHSYIEVYAIENAKLTYRELRLPELTALGDDIERVIKLKAFW